MALNGTSDVRQFTQYSRLLLYSEFEPDEDFCGQNIVQLQSTVLREMLHITTAIGWPVKGLQ